MGSEMTPGQQRSQTNGSFFVAHISAQNRAYLINTQRRLPCERCPGYQVGTVLCVMEQYELRRVG